MSTIKRIVHISDMHFGTETASMLDLLKQDIERDKPTLIIASGDFTQRAYHEQYQAAQAFLKSIAQYKLLCVPGNHDISLYNLIERFLYPFKKYQRYISANLNPSYEDETLAILGINSVTPTRSITGTISKPQLQLIQDYFLKIPNHKIKMIVMHHNLIRSKRHKIVINTEELLHVLVSCNVKLILSGHLHYACIEQLKREFISYPMYVITAGTTVSKRIREGQNSYNILDIDDQGFIMIVREFNKHKFASVSKQEYQF